MHILFGEEQATELSSKYTVLELDTIKVGLNGPEITAYCAVENIPFDEVMELDTLKNIHNQLMSDYKTRNWQDCLASIETLKGSWSGELDSFYTEMTDRIANYLTNDPGPSWSNVIVKQS